MRQPFSVLSFLPILVACVSDDSAPARNPNPPDAGTPLVDGGAPTIEADAGSDAEVGEPKTVVAGGSRACVVYTHGRMACWGSNDKGALAADTTSVLSPTLIKSQDDVVLAAIGSQHMCIVHKDGRVSCVGDNERGQLGVPLAKTGLSTFAFADVEGLPGPTLRISAGEAQTCVVLKDLSAYCFGRGFEPMACAVGLPNDAPNSPAPEPRRIGGTQSFVDVATFYSHTCLIDSPGKDVYCAGLNFHGELGLPVATPANLNCNPLRLMDGSFSSHAEVSLGTVHTCALRFGSVACAGQASEGSIGTPVSPERISTLRGVAWKGPNDFTQIAATYGGICGVHADGRVECVGRNSSGELGRPTPATLGEAGYVEGLGNVISLAQGAGFACAISKAPGAPSKVFCWGANDQGQLGRITDGGSSDRVPTEVNVPNLRR